ncbi:unnamed protein product [Bursaphelenchus xylophilus]|uniref:(pine wood nematode) hypothetical protein n=1 Tax=Bursaphelenchus xylophilus TaxID=6326 RepID=A0A1I7SA07_BURXY|nr:unnamed protein product [Bursaphelenchus xylophilus]CAG9126082.1 unnamed protein product [Bursaphelenchus xylophilus]
MSSRPDHSDDGQTASDHDSRPRSICNRPKTTGQFLHDYSPDDPTLDDFTRRLCTMNVYRVFFDYTTVLQQDMKEPSSAFDKYPELNRYADIRCIDQTRVKVPCPGATHDYIHANYVDGFREPNKFILTQAPMQKTVEQFWHMIWKEKATIICGLTVIDGVKCPRYIPVSPGTKLTFGQFTITHAGTRHVRDTYDATVLFLSKENEPARKVLHIAFYCWPDKGTPTRPTEILHLLEDINYNRKLLTDQAIKAKWLGENENSPIVVHCLAGVGRSGALAALDICARKLDETFAKSHGAMVDVRDTVTRLRTQREMAIQKPEQYLFVHLAVVEYALRQRYYNNVAVVDISQFTANH